MERVTRLLSSGELRYFTTLDLEVMQRLGELKLANANRLGTPHINRFRQDRIQGYVDGYKGEWAVSDSLGLERQPDTSGRADPGFDLEFRGRRIQVRYTPYSTGRVMCPANRPFKADWIVLVVGTSDPLVVRIVGATTVEEFNSMCRRHDWGYGETLFVEQADLEPWEAVKECWG